MKIVNLENDTQIWTWENFCNQKLIRTSWTNRVKDMKYVYDEDLVKI
ncbi:hypothetical protein HYD70_00700 [Mycoplasmopsis bovis]|nr:hypothetical protein [Mycoplasmopsis bovis]QQH49689.1 hypothetical protein HYD70_00700 [Mycoplasmopsis bovis]